MKQPINHLFFSIIVPFVSAPACLYGEELIPSPRREAETSPSPDSGAPPNRSVNEGGMPPASQDVTGLMVKTCKVYPPELALPRNRDSATCGEIAEVTPYHEEDGLLWKVKAALDWTSGAPLWATVGTYPWLPERNSVYGRGTRDLFDGDGTTEPETIFEVCAQNACSEPVYESFDCLPKVCLPIKVRGVVNLEGDWCFSGASFGEGCVKTTVVQGGRELFLLPWQIKGIVVGDEVRLKDDTIIYFGKIAPDRKSIKGQTEELLTGAIIADWEASR
ncbi:hypothetical protein EPN90_04310 [Patescibacteria group bacterium]|nr:MAG: hypothetical protein EPN90_04310 [Patescibacteria group bacterium]